MVAGVVDTHRHRFIAGPHLNAERPAHPLLGGADVR